ncbi:OmpH family outer membrane protein [Cysteiniphilum halobium]|uniref:OmpH family outer membrane protein n=1 Tax=Cysteiniphilum halobium TaxID=2219059 RepID=UPI000E64DA9A|nr:OmpH family outer membrane protein [Cysteiniphilum halobium]
MKKLAMISLASMTVASAAFATDASSLKIGLVNPVEIYQTVPQGEESIHALQAKLKPKADELQKQQQGLMEKMQTLQTNAPTLTKSDLDKQQKALTDEQDKFKQQAVAFRQSEMQQEQKIAQDFQASFNTAVESVAKKGKYSLILSSQAVAYVAPDLKVDVTDQVVAQMKKQDTPKKDKK